MYIFGGYVPPGPYDKYPICVNQLSSIEIVNNSEINIVENYYISGDPVLPRPKHYSQLIGEKLFIWGGEISRLNKYNFLNIINLNTRVCQTVKLICPLSSASHILNDKILFSNNNTSQGPYHVFNIKTQKFHEEYIQIERSEQWTDSCFKKIMSYNGEALFITDKIEIWTSYFEDDSSKGEASLSSALEKVENSPISSPDIRKKLFQEKLYTDVVFVVEDRKFPCHKSVLSAASSYFANMFSSGMSESHEKEIPVPDMKVKTFEAFLEYAYCNEVKFDKTVAKELIVYSEKILFSSLKIECEKILARRMNEENILSIYEAAEIAQAENLKEAALRFIRKNFKEIVKKNGKENISESLLIELIEDKL